MESGAFTYAPKTHLFHYPEKDSHESANLSNEELDQRILAADYVPVELTAGSVLFLVNETWHAVNPIYHLRRRVTSFYVNSTLDSLRTDFQPNL